MKNKSILFYLPPSQFYEEQYLIIKNSLKKAGFQLFVTSGTSGCCSGVNGLKVQPDVKLFNVNPENFNVFLITGGKILSHEGFTQRISATIRSFINTDRILAAIFNGTELLKASEFSMAWQNSEILAADEALSGKTAQKIFVRNNFVICTDPGLNEEFSNSVVELLKKR